MYFTFTQLRIEYIQNSSTVRLWYCAYTYKFILRNWHIRHNVAIYFVLVLIHN